MSSTNRGGERKKNDYYITPVVEITKFLEAFKEDTDVDFSRFRKILDPCAGGDADVGMSYPSALSDFGVDPASIRTIDIREDSRAESVGDYLKMVVSDRFDLIISNPPFTFAREFITKALTEVDTNGFLVMLLRITYFGSQDRHPFWKEHMPLYTYVHSTRMSFTSDGNTDAVEYMHCIWKPGVYPKFTQLRVI